MKKVSIVLPVYNGERYLKQAIESILAQTYENWELIIVDDSSIDRTTEIVQDYAQRDKRIQVIRNAENQKLPRSLNIGFRQAQGEYLTWTSDDNLYEKTAIEVMVQALECNPGYGLAYCDMACVYEDGLQLSRASMDIRRFYVEDVIGACFLYRREVLKTIGEYDPDMVLVEDYDYWLRIDQSYQILHIPECLYQYRFHYGSLTVTKEHEVAAQLYRMRLRHLDFLLERADEDEKEVLFLDMWTHSSEDIWRRRSQFFLGGVLPERLKWLNRVVETGNMIPTGKKVILFGAGAYGQKALDFFGKESVYCFVDNDRKRVGALVKGVPVISFEDLVKMDTSYQIVLCVGSRFLLEIAGQMENAGIKKYSLFLELWRRNWRRREMPTLGREAIYQMVDEYRACQEGKRLIFFGAGKIGREALAYCRKEGISVSYIADNNSELWGSKVGEVEVISPAQIYELQPFLIVITCDQVKEIAVQMEEYKLKQYISYFLFKSRYSKADRASSEATSVERACNWILQNQQKNGGVSAFSGSLHEYPEVTGYIIPTMLQYGFQDEAMAMAQYLSAMANPDGSFSASDSGRVYLFDTAQALRGLNAIRKITDQYASLQQKTGEYLFSALARHHGLFPKNYTDDPIIPETIMLFALPPMLEYAQSVNSGEKTTLVFQAAERYLQEPEALSAKTLTHFLAYQIDGLIDLGYSEAVKPIFERLLASQREDGAIPAYEGAGWACITGCSQLAICLYKLGMRDPADRLMAWVERYMEADGGFLGSVGPGADYFEDREPSWAVKFYLDAYERMICAHFDYEFAPVAPAEIDAENGEVLAVLEELQGGERVLEVGCGKGRILKRIHERFENCKLKGVDISKEMLSHVPNFVETSIGNMEFLPYADGKFDLVYTVECIEHSVNLRAAVRELARVCKPGGKIVIIDKQQTSWGRLATPPWEHWPDRAMLEQMLRNYCSDVTSSHICLKGYDERDDMFVKWRGVK